MLLLRCLTIDAEKKANKNLTYSAKKQEKLFSKNSGFQQFIWWNSTYLRMKRSATKVQYHHSTINPHADTTPATMPQLSQKNFQGGNGSGRLCTPILVSSLLSNYVPCVKYCTPTDTRKERWNSQALRVILNVLQRDRVCKQAYDMPQRWTVAGQATALMVIKRLS